MQRTTKAVEKITKKNNRVVTQLETNIEHIENEHVRIQFAKKWRNIIKNNASQL